MTILLDSCIFTSESVSEKKIENRSSFGEVMDNVVVPCFLTHSVHLPKL